MGIEQVSKGANLFGTNPPMTIDTSLAGRICVDALLLGHQESAQRHGISVGAIERLHRVRSLSDSLDWAIKAELCSSPHNLDTHARVVAWCSRPIGCRQVIVNEPMGPVVLESFDPAAER